MIRVEHLHKIYRSGDKEITALADVSLTIESGSCTAIMGASGSGKSTLLHCLGGLDRFDRGQIHLGPHTLGGLSDRELTRLRRGTIGFVFQFFNLLPTLTVLENVLLPVLLDGKSGPEWDGKAEALLSEVGLEKRLDHLPHQLSGGEMQRVAVARALVHEPRVLLADEPTGNLDSINSERVIGILKNLSKKHGSTLILVTHSDEVAKAADRIVRMKDGQVVS